MSAAKRQSTSEAIPGQYLYDALVAFLRGDGWPVSSEDESERALAVTVEGDNGRWVCAAQVLIERPVLLFASIMPAFVTPPARPSRVGEFINRANAGLVFGGFQFNMDEGEVRYVNCLDFTGIDGALVSDAGVLDGLIRQMVYANVSTVDRYFSALMAVVHTDADPAQAVANIEANEG